MSLCPLLELDDACIHHIIRYLLPLPDVFNLAKTCWGLRRLASDQRMWKCVCPANHPDRSACLKRSAHVFETLAAALEHCRPGDTIWLAPGVTHTVRELQLRCTVHLLGGGAKPEDTVIVAAPGAESALDVRATAKVTNVSLRARRGCCVLHRQGTLRLERCSLACEGEGLEHLYACLVTTAQAQAPPALPAPVVSAPAQRAPGATRPPDAAGRLCVRETKIRGGEQAVHCHGSGAIRAVRVIYQRSCPLYWFDVDSTHPGVSGAGLRAAPAPAWSSDDWAAAKACSAAAGGGSCGSVEGHARCCPPAPAGQRGAGQLGLCAGGVGKLLAPRSVQQALEHLDPLLLQQVLGLPGGAAATAAAAAAGLAQVVWFVELWLQLVHDVMP